MLVHGIPWQAALAQAFMATLVYGAALLVSLVLGIFGWMPTLGGILLIGAFVALLLLIPLFTNLSRTFFSLLLVYLAIHVLITLLSYALHYRHAGLMADGSTVHSFRDSLYFSITTWTTLGYGDFAPVSRMRLVTSLEALTGVISMAIAASFIWLWCTENMIPKELALFDGDRRHKSSLSVHRMRIRTLTGTKKDLGPEWVDPAVPGVSYRHNPQKGEWEVVSEETRLSDGDIILETESKCDPTRPSRATSEPAPGAAPEAPDG
jgi:hypothetical protein